MANYSVKLHRYLPKLAGSSEYYTKSFEAKTEKQAAALAIMDFKRSQPFTIKGEVVEVESVALDEQSSLLEPIYGFSFHHDLALKLCIAEYPTCPFGCGKDGAPNCANNVRQNRCEPAKRTHVEAIEIAREMRDLREGEGNE